MPSVITRQRSLPVLLEVEGGNVGEIRIRDQPRVVPRPGCIKANESFSTVRPRNNCNVPRAQASMPSRG